MMILPSVLITIIGACISATYATSATKTAVYWSLRLDKEWVPYDSATRAELDAAYANPGSVKKVCYTANNDHTYYVDLLGSSGIYRNPKKSPFRHWHDNLLLSDTIQMFIQVDANDQYRNRPLRRVTSGTNGQVTWQIWELQADPSDTWLNGDQDDVNRFGKWVDVESTKYKLAKWSDVRIPDQSTGVTTINSLSTTLEYVLQSPTSHIFFSQWTGTKLTHYNARFLSSTEAANRKQKPGPVMKHASDCVDGQVPAAVQWSADDNHRTRPICRIRHSVPSGGITPMKGNVHIAAKKSSRAGIEEYDLYITPKSSTGTAPTRTFEFDTKQVETELIKFFGSNVAKTDSAINDDVASPKYFWHATLRLRNPAKNLKLDQATGPDLWTVIMSPYSKSLDWAFTYTIGYGDIYRRESNLGDYSGFIAVIKSTKTVTSDPTDPCHIKFTNVGVTLHATDDYIYGRVGNYGNMLSSILNQGKSYRVKYPSEHPDAYIFPAIAQKQCGLQIAAIFHLNTVETVPKPLFVDPAVNLKTTKRGDETCPSGRGCSGGGNYVH